MPSNFFSKRVKNPVLTAEIVPDSGPTSSSSNGSFKIGVVPPSPHTTGSGSDEASFRQHRRVRSQDRDSRHIPDRHEVSLAARPESDIASPIDETELTPTLGRPMQTSDWRSFRSATSPSSSPHQLSPASSTGNLKGFVDRHGARSHLLQPPPNHKHSDQSMRATTRPPPPPLNIKQSITDLRNAMDIQRPHDELSVLPPNVLSDSPTSLTSPNARPQEPPALSSDVDVRSVRSATSSSSKHKSSKRRVSNPRKNSNAALGTPLPNTFQPPPVPPLPASISQSRSTASMNGATHWGDDSTLPQASEATPTRSPNISLTRSEISDGDTFLSGEDSGSSDDELDLNEQDIPVTGFAVASSRRNADFHELFPSIPEGDYLIEDYGCALQREILIQGRLYVSENHICFHANIFGWITDLSIPIYEITGLEKKMTAFVIPNAIQITTRQAKYTFASFLARDTTYDVIANIWRLARPEDTLEVDSRNASTRDINSAVQTVSEGSKSAQRSDKVTQCACSKDGGHFSELALETVVPGTPEKIYNLIFASGFMKDFMKVEQRLTDIQMSDWAPIHQGSKLLQRNMSYIKPLNNSVGPKQTKCELHDETVHCDFDDYVVTDTMTKTPDVPSGGVFVVKTRTCLMWASPITTRIIVTTQVDWTGRSFIKGLIERSAIEGQKEHHCELDRAMRMYIQEHHSEFVPEGLDPSAVAPAEPLTPHIEANGGGSDAISIQEARKARERDRNRRGLQWAYDTLDGAYGVAERSTKGAIELVKEAWDQSSSTTILWFVIVLLVLSNVWTLALVGNREEVGRRKEMRRAEEKERWMQTVVAGVWEELSAERARLNAVGAGAGGSGVSASLLSVPVGDDVQMEVANIDKVLDAVEQRVRTIRESLQGLN